jgi:hypothetical protein
MILTYIKWRDASSEEGTGHDPSKPIEPALVDLVEIGFLLAENDEAVCLAMEHCPAGTHANRYRLNIPKINILERKDMEFESVIGVKKVRRPRKKTGKVELLATMEAKS